MGTGITARIGVRPTHTLEDALLRTYEQEIAALKATINQSITDLQGLSNMVAGDPTLEEMVHHLADQLHAALVGPERTT
jgi:hypothetical protein